MKFEFDSFLHSSRSAGCLARQLLNIYSGVYFFFCFHSNILAMHCLWPVPGLYVINSETFNLF